MIKKALLGLIISSTAVGVSAAYAKSNAPSCESIGGVGIANFYPQGEGKPVIISAALIGNVNNAAGKITAQRETPTGLEMDMEHHFGAHDGGGFQTKDLGVLTAVPGKPGRFMIEITYKIQEDVTRGTLKGVKGQFSSYGLVDLRNPDSMAGLVRYSGEICRR